MMGIENLKNCRRCGKMFTHVFGDRICDDCRKAEEELFKAVKEYVWDHKGANITEVAEHFDVKPDVIKKYVRDGRLQLDENSPLKVNCENCGVVIMSGRYCDKCKLAIHNEIIASAEPKVPKNIKVFSTNSAAAARKGAQFHTKQGKQLNI